MTAPPAPVRDDEDAEVARQLTRLALRYTVRSVPVQLVTAACTAWWGFEAGAGGAAAGALLIGLAVAGWRLSILRRYAATKTLDERWYLTARRELEGNAVLSGLAWMVSTALIYPQLDDVLQTTYVAILFSSLTIACFFLTLVGRSFPILAAFQLGPLLAVSLAVDSVRSPPVAVLCVVVALAALRASREFGAVAAQAIRHGLQAEAANASLAEAKRAAEAANRAKSQFLATMSHEIRTPMNGVLGALSLLRHATQDPNHRRMVQTAASAGETLMQILNDVLDHSKIEAGRLELFPAEASLHALATSVAALLESNAEAKSLTLELDLAGCRADRVVCDGQRLRQVLLNLVGNAIKFTEHGTVTLRLASEPAGAGRVRVSFSVVDTGIGIAPEAAARLFTPFQQIDGTLQRQHGGTGLGLSISQRIVEAMGGRIGIDSRPGVGSTFAFALTMEEAAALPVPTAPAVDSLLGDLDGRPRPSGQVLVVEDNPVNLVIALEMLRSLGVEPLEAENGAVALERIAGGHIDLVLMDCNMPVMDGYTAVARIREREARLGLARLPVVAMTANAFGEDVARALAAGMDAHLAKPYTRAQLRSTLEKWTATAA